MSGSRGGVGFISTYKTAAPGNVLTSSPLLAEPLVYRKNTPPLCEGGLQGKDTDLAAAGPAAARPRAEAASDGAAGTGHGG